MRIVTLTGGLGAGKSTAAAYLHEKGAAVVDTDAVGRALLTTGSELLGRVAREFGEDEVLLADGSLDRAALARKAFSSEGWTRMLDSIVHPAVAREVGVAVEQLRLLAQPPIAVVLEVPLLVEAPVFAELADVVVAMVAPESVRKERAVAAGMESADAERRIRIQATDAQRAELADVVIVNDGPVERLHAELDRFWDEHIAVGGAAV